MRNAQHLVASFETWSPEVVGAQVEILDISTECAVEYDDPLVDRIKIGLALHRQYHNTGDEGLAVILNSDDGNIQMSSNRDQNITPLTRRGRRIASSVVGNLGSLVVIVGVLGLLVMSFVGSSAAVSSSVRSAFGREDVRRAAANELVDRIQNGDDIGAKIVVHVARGKVVDSIEQSLSENDIRSAAGETAASAYEFLIDGKTNVVIDIQYFADAAFKAMRVADPQIPQFLAPQVDPIDLSRAADGSDFSAIRTWVFLATWGFLLGGLALLAVSWFLSPAPRWLKVRRIGIREFVWGLALIGFAYAARSI